MLLRLARVFDAFGSLSLAVTISWRSNSLTSTGAKVMPIRIYELAATIPSVKSRWNELLMLSLLRVDPVSVGFSDSSV